MNRFDATRRRLVCLLGTLPLTGTALAQSDWRRVAVPSYNPAHMMQGLYAFHMAPRAQAFALQANGLRDALQALCEGDATLDAARERWRTTVLAWEQLATVAIGPVVERRSIRQIDFAPTRPPLIERAIAAQPADAAAMERVGTPAKGLPALEWLLWTRPVKARSPACAYAREVAADIAREAGALAEACRDGAVREWTDEDAVTGMNEFVNQWVGGIERLRWAQMEKPLRAADGRRPDFPRRASGTTAANWAVQWEVLRTLSIFSGDRAAEPGRGLVPIESYLRGRGRNAVADALVQAATQVSRQFGTPLKPAAPKRVLAAAQALTALKRLAEAELAAALDVSIGFSDADGD